ncbi:transposase [Sinorhizobium meliloti CCNWSX0020]|uniref:Transposase n=1 Tax=Sinorhizobium meliloti CCNWSX0020 TaxID=1107881 RepID=H0FV89_RHIML|nr:transposase [Sinorhizobium meliloti CCNWSX0020]
MYAADGPINGIAFTALVEQCLAPTLDPGDIVILDNLGSHKGKPARNAIRDAGAHLFFLPPYSPRSQSDRDDVRQTQDPAAQSRRAQRRRDMEARRRSPQSLRPARMRRLSQACRACFNINLTDSSFDPH